MPPTDFRHAPPPTTVDGLLAVPIDVQQVQAVVTLDGATSTAQADATMTYTVGPTAGNPLFDLRQTIGQVWVDGTPIDPALLAAHDVGAGSFSTILVLEAVQAAGSVHTLRLVYALGTPQSQLGGGAYPPVLQWSAGPKVRWTFGFSDLNAGRYLEAWLPSNLIFDQYPVILEIKLTGTLAAHSLISNGAITVLGTNHWSVQFPDRFTPLSPLVEVRASDTVQQATDSVVLPISGTNVTIEAWKLVGGPQSLTTEINDAKTLLTANETDYGPFLGNRFVIFFHGASGGMEYSGATTTSVGALAHETFHSWFARGITPASQSDGWWDEAFTTFHDDGADDVEPFDFLAPPVVLCSRQPFQRRTPSNSYSDGSRFFRGVAGLTGLASLRTAMGGLYEARGGSTPVSTAALEEHLVSATGKPQIVDAFHRFVFGFGDPSPPPRLWLRDDPGHTGADTWDGPFWDSPDLWIRKADDGGTVHESPELGQNNWFYARIRNDAGGQCRHFVVTFNVKEFAGTEFVYPDDFLPCVAARAEFDLAPGDTRVVSARWPGDRVPAPGTHPCLLVSVLARGDHPTAGAHVWEHANLAQKNLTVVDLVPGEFLILPVVIYNLRAETKAMLEVWRDPELPETDVSLVHRSKDFFATGRLRPLLLPPPRSDRDRLMDCGGLEPHQRDRFGGILTSRRPDRIASRFPEAVELRVRAGDRIRVPVALASEAPTVVGLKITAPEQVEPGTTFTTHLAHRRAAGKQLAGGVAVQVRVRAQTERENEPVDQ